MLEASIDKIEIQIDPHKIQEAGILTGKKVQQVLSDLWDSDEVFLAHYLALFFDKPDFDLTDRDSFITLSFISHGYVEDPGTPIDINRAKEQIEVDLEILNKESLFTAEESIFFDNWWPKPAYNPKNHSLAFGVATKDYQGKLFNRTINQIILTRYGHLVLNYNFSEVDLTSDKPLSYWIKKLEEIADAISIKPGFSYSDINRDDDLPSRSKMINLVLSSEIL